MTRKRGRPPRDDAPLSRERIYAAALELLESAGWEAFSMRRLAARLQVDPMALYRHVPDKAGLLAELLNQLLGSFRMPAQPPGEWRDQIDVFATAYLDLMIAYPNLIRLFALDPQAGAVAAAQINQPVHAALVQAGLPPDQLIQARDTIIDYLNGYGLVLAARHRSAHGPLPADHRAGLAVILAGIAALFLPPDPPDRQ